MKIYSIPGFGECVIDNLFLDLNGTINFYGELRADIKDYIRELKKFFKIYIVSANTRGDLAKIAKELDVHFKQTQNNINEQDAKMNILNELRPENTIVIGNGNNDVKCLKNARIGIAVIGREGASTRAINAADISITDISEGFRLILDENAIRATLRF
ncbi:MAG: hypothetical protein GF364_20495 [Candidatus Lokiarchaeota archaeon]|nr:hypothetical protein [Candidatus Lokiarchaeota archaeon]